MKALAIVPPQTADRNALKLLSAEMQIKGTSDQVQVSPMTLTLDDTIINSEFSLKHFSQPVINASVKLDKIDLDRYLPPVVEGVPPEAQASSTKSAGDSAPQPLPIPVELIRSLDATAAVEVKKLIIRKLDIDDVSLKVRVKDSVATMSPVMFKIAKGSIRSDVTLDVKTSTPRFQINQVINKVEAAPLARALAGDDYVSGLLDFKAAINSQGFYVKDITKNLNGNLSFHFENGAAKGFNLGELIRKAKAKLDKAEYAPSEVPKQTDFAELLGSATIDKGIVDNKDLSAKSPLLRVEGKGQVNLAAENIDYLVTTYLVGSSKGQGGKSVEELKGIPIPIQLTGPFNDIQWDYKWSIIRKAFQDKYKEKAKKEIEVKKQEIKKELDEKKDETKEELKQKAKDKLKKLLKF
jgi:AsmA protein